MKDFIKNFQLYAKTMKEIEQDEQEIKVESNWGDNYPPNMNDNWARELGII